MRTRNAGVTRRVLLLTLLLLPLSTRLSIARAEPATPDRLLIVQPGYPGTTADARGFVGRLCAFIRDHGGPPVVSGVYHNSEKAALESVRKESPTVGIVSLGFYLKHRRHLALEPILWSRPDEPFHVVVRRGTYSKLEDLAGRSVTGTAFVEPDFVHRVLFSGADGKPLEKSSRTWKTTPARSFVRGIRDVTRGRQDAVLLGDRDVRGMRRLRRAKELEVIHSTRAFPIAVVVSVGKLADRGAGRPAGKLAARLRVALSGMEKSGEGKEILETMGISSFAVVDARRMKELEGLHGCKD